MSTKEPPPHDLPHTRTAAADKINPFHARYGRQDIPLPDQQPNSFTKKLLSRTSCRNFLPTPLPNGTLELLIAAAQSAPTSGMLQTWSVISLNAADRKNLIESKVNQGIFGGRDKQNFIALNTCSIFLIWLADLNRTNFILQNNKNNPVLDPDVYFGYQGHEHSPNLDPRVKATCAKAEYHLKAITDATIAAQTLLITAESMGISGTYMGAIRQLPRKFLKDTFNLPKYTFPLFGMALGIQVPPTRPPTPRARLGQEIILHHSTYKPMSSLEELNEYNKVHGRMSDRRVSTFQNRIVERMWPSPAKDSIGEFLKEQGFNFE